VTPMRVRTVTTAAWMTGAVLLAHLGAYRISYDDPHARTHALAASGHGWTALLPVLLAAALLGAVLGTITTALRERRRSGAAETKRHGIIAELLTMTFGGAAIYTGIELLERAMHHGDLDGALHDLAHGGYVPLLAGIALIVVTAPLLVVFRRTIDALIGERSQLPTARAALPVLPEGLPRRAPFFGIEPNRGPPLVRPG
jgi:hypothetical protein